MPETINRRTFFKTAGSIGGLSLFPIPMLSCGTGIQEGVRPVKEYDIFAKYAPAKKILIYDTTQLQEEFPQAAEKELWLLRALCTILQGLINRVEPRLFLRHEAKAVDWLKVYQQQGHDFITEAAASLQFLLEQYAPSLAGYIIFDPDNLHSLNVAQTWASLENWLVILPELEDTAIRLGLQKKQDLRGQWPDRMSAYEWAFANLFPRCSKHVLGDCCMDFPFFPSTATWQIRDFLVANHAFTVDLSASLRQRREYRLLDKIYAAVQFPAGMWGWHCTRDHEHYAVERAARQGVYTLCAASSPNLTVHGAFPSLSHAPVKQKPSPRKNLVAEKNKVYIALMMTDGDSLWAMETQQMHNWGMEQRRDFPLSWGFLPLLADTAPAMYRYFIDNMKPADYMVAGPSGAGYTYPHLYPDPKQFLAYTKHYMQRCGLEIVNITNWNDYTNWQEVDLPWFNPLLYRELDNCLGYVRGMGESAFESHYNFSDKPYLFCGEGIHRNDQDDVATMKNFIDANPNRPLFIFSLINVAVSMERIQNVVTSLESETVEFVRLDDLMHLIKSAFSQKLISEDLYPNRTGNEGILRREAPANWQGTAKQLRALIPILNAATQEKALAAMNSEAARLSPGQKITAEDQADVLAYALCSAMFSLVKDTLNRQGIYVNAKQPSVDAFMAKCGNWPGSESILQLNTMWQEWDRSTFAWQRVVEIGRALLQVHEEAKRLFDQE